MEIKKILSYPVINHVLDAKYAANVFGVDWENNAYELPKEIGKGQIEAYDYDNFSVMISEFKFKKPYIIERLKSDIKDYLIFGFILNGATSHFQIHSQSRLGRLQFGAHISTPSTSSSGIFKGDIWHRQLSILVRKDWLEDYLNTELPRHLSDPNVPLFIFLEMTLAIAKTLKVIFEKNINTNLRYEHVKLKCKEALILCSEQIIENASNYNQKRHHPEELSKVLEISSFISENLDKNLTIKDISDKYCVNKDKLQILFKSVFGVSVGRFVKQSKMELAYIKLLKGFTVSEVGYNVGYSNLSHFARAFKSIYGINPSLVNKEY